MTMTMNHSSNGGQQQQQQNGDPSTTAGAIEWHTFWSDKVGREYYFHKPTNQVVWTLPPGTRAHPLHYQEKTTKTLSTVQGTVDRSASTSTITTTTKHQQDKVDGQVPVDKPKRLKMVEEQQKKKKKKRHYTKDAGGNSKLQTRKSRRKGGNKKDVAGPGFRMGWTLFAFSPSLLIGIFIMVKKYREIPSTAFTMPDDVNMFTSMTADVVGASMQMNETEHATVTSSVSTKDDDVTIQSSHDSTDVVTDGTVSIPKETVPADMDTDTVVKMGASAASMAAVGMVADALDETEETREVLVDPLLDNDDDDDVAAAFEAFPDFNDYDFADIDDTIDDDSIDVADDNDGGDAEAVMEAGDDAYDNAEEPSDDTGTAMPEEVHDNVNESSSPIVDDEAVSGSIVKEATHDKDTDGDVNLPVDSKPISPSATESMKDGESATDVSTDESTVDAESKEASASVEEDSAETEDHVDADTNGEEADVVVDESVVDERTDEPESTTDKPDAVVADSDSTETEVEPDVDPEVEVEPEVQTDIKPKMSSQVPVKANKAVHRAVQEGMSRFGRHIHRGLKNILKNRRETMNSDVHDMIDTMY